MLSIKEELRSFKKKSIKTYDMPLNDLHDPLSAVETKIQNMDKFNANIDELKEEIEKNKEKIFSLKEELSNKEYIQEEFVKRVVVILDQVDNLYRFGIHSEDQFLMNNLNSLMRIVKRELKEVGFEEIPAIGESFNLELHECVETIGDEGRDKYEIVDVLKKGYKFNGKVVRQSEVIVIK